MKCPFCGKRLKADYPEGWYNCNSLLTVRQTRLFFYKTQESQLLQCASPLSFLASFPSKKAVNIICYVIRLIIMIFNMLPLIGFMGSGI